MLKSEMSLTQTQKRGLKVPKSAKMFWTKNTKIFNTISFIYDQNNYAILLLIEIFFLKDIYFFSFLTVMSFFKRKNYPNKLLNVNIIEFVNWLVKWVMKGFFLKVTSTNNNNKYVLKFEGLVKIWHEIWRYVLNLTSYTNDRMVYVKGRTKVLHTFFLTIQ